MYNYVYFYKYLSTETNLYFLKQSNSKFFNIPFKAVFLHTAKYLRALICFNGLVSDKQL